MGKLGTNAVKAKQRRARPSSAYSNDELLRSGATQILGLSGIEGLSFAAVSKEAGLSHTAVSYRFETIEDLLLDVWQFQCMPGFISELDQLIRDLLDTATPETLIAKKIRDFFKENDETHAAIEIIAYAATNKKIRETISGNLTELMNSKKKKSKTYLAQYAFLWQTMIGMLFHIRLNSVSPKKLSELIIQISAALSNPVEEMELPKVDASHLKAKRFNTGDEIEDDLLQSAVKCVGEYGYANSTTNMIAKEAGVTTGSLFARFPTKLDILVAAASIKYRVGYEQNLRFITMLVEKYGPGQGNAIFLREYLMPGLELERAIEIETLRVSWHRRILHDRLAKNISDFLKQIGEQEKTPKTADEKIAQLVRVAIPTGTLVLATVYPRAWQIPYSTVTPSVFRAP